MSVIKNKKQHADRGACGKQQGYAAGLVENRGEKTMWSDRIEQTRQMRREHLAGGGGERVRKQHEKGKMTAMERIGYLLDQGSFHPVDSFFETRQDSASLLQGKTYLGDGVITGWGTIDGRRVCVAAEDFTVIGGTLGEIHAQKICNIQDMALEMKIPLILLNDSGGARIEEGILSLSGYGGMFRRHVQASGVIPQIAAILGPCSGGASYSPALCDFVFMVEGLSKMCLTGPAVVESVLGQKATLDELGGTQVHGCKSGVAHMVCADEKACLDRIRALLAYLPSNSSREAAQELISRWSASYGERVSSRGFSEKPFESIVPDNPRRAYDVHEVITNILQNDSFYEIQETFAMNAVTGFGVFDGRVLGIVANQPAYLGGAIDCNAADKIARFIRTCDCFGIPLLTLVDVPAFFPGVQQEQSGIIRHGAKILYAYAEATVPKVTLIMRKAYGGAFIAMNCKMMSADAVYAWPIAEIAVMGADGAVQIISRRQIAQAADPQQEYERQKAQYEEKFSNPFLAAKKGYVDEIILPEETVGRLKETFRLLRTKEAQPYTKKHGNIPL